MGKMSLWALAVFVAALVVSTSVFAGKGGNGKPGGGGGGGGGAAPVDLVFLAHSDVLTAFNEWAVYAVDANGNLDNIGEDVIPNDSVTDSFSQGGTWVGWSPAGEVLAASLTGGDEPELALRDPATGDWEVYPRTLNHNDRPLGPWTRQRDEAGTFRPYTEQRLTGVHEYAWPDNALHPTTGERLKSRNVALFPPNDTDAPVVLTGCRYIETSTSGVFQQESATEPIYVPEQPEQSDTSWMIYRYTLTQHPSHEHAPPLVDEWRILTLDVGAWPAVTVVSDDPLSGPWPSENLSPDGRTLVIVQNGDLALAPIDFDGPIPVVSAGLATVVPVSPPRGFSFTADAFQARLDEDASQILIGLDDRKGKRRAFVQSVGGSGLTQVDNDKSAGIEYSGDLSRASFRP